MPERTVLQDFAELVAADVAGVPKSEVCAGVDAGAVEWVILVELIMGFITQMLEQCQQNKASLRESVKNPTRWQRVRAHSVVKANCDECSGFRWRQRARQMTDALLTLAAQQEDTVIDQVIDQVRADW